MTGNKIMQQICPCLLLSFLTFQQIIIQMNIASKIYPFNIMWNTELYFGFVRNFELFSNINVTNLNSFWNFMTGNKNMKLLCPMTAWYIVKMTKES